MIRLAAGAFGGYFGALVTALLGAESSPLDPSSPSFWTSLGVGGMIAVAFGKGWVVPGQFHNRAEQRADAAMEAIKDDVLPALVQANFLATQQQEVTREQNQLIDRLLRRLEALDPPRGEG